MITQTHSEKKIAQTQVLREIGMYFLRLGVTGFGGPLAVVAQMERDLAGRWISSLEFSQVFSAIKTLPGPVAFQTAVFLGHERGRKEGVGFWGAALAGSCFLFPSVILMLVLGLSRASWGEWEWTRSALVGLQAAALGLIIASLIPIAKNARTNGDGERMAKWMFALFSFVVTLLQPSLEPVAIITCGMLALRPNRTRTMSVALAAVPTALVGVSMLDIHMTLFLTSLKAGTLVFGSGLAIIPLLGGEFVDKLQWMTQAEFLEALMFGQVTPGPVMVTATYIGTRVAGISGGFVATIGVFLIPFIHMTTWFPLFWRRVNQSAQWHRFSFGALSAVIGALAASTMKLLEPVYLTALEIEKLSLNASVVTLLLWVVIVPLAFYFTFKKKRPAWAVVLGGGIVALLALSLV
jgi:chromate transporter